LLPPPRQVPPASDAEKTATLQKLATLIAALLITPQLLWGWGPGQAAEQSLAPALAGLVLFDGTYMAALLWRLRQSGL
jgi:hypothetical protein